MNIRYVTLDPTGNITCLVPDPVSPADRAAVTAALMDRCEQVGYLLAPLGADAHARLEMMGGEFCGNASMAAAAYLCARDGVKTEADVALEVSGAHEIIRCHIRPVSDGVYEGTVAMPPVHGVSRTRLGTYTAAAVRMEGIAHLILEDVSLPDDEAEALLRRAAADLPEAAAGLLQYDSGAQRMRPLVYVKSSGTMVWETGCGSGTTAVGAYLAAMRGVRRAGIRQPGGVIAEETVPLDGMYRTRITGLVRVGQTETLRLPAV